MSGVRAESLFPVRDALDALVSELRRLRREGVSRVSVDAGALGALRAACSAPEAPVGPVASEKESRPAVVVSPAPVSPVASAAEPERARILVESPKPKPVAAPAVPALPPPPSVVLPAGDAAARLAALEAMIASDPAVRSGLVPGRVAVGGEGASSSPLLFLIHMPGAEDGFSGKPLSGAEGDLFAKIIGAMGFSRERVHTAAVVPYRPEVGGAHREPHREEYAYCLPWLRARIAEVNPRVIVTLGGGAAEALFGPGESISKTRGVFREFEGRKVMPTYHISYLIRNNTNRSKRVVWEDLLAVMDTLGMPVSEKQRGYFAAKP